MIKHVGERPIKTRGSFPYPAHPSAKAKPPAKAQPPAKEDPVPEDTPPPTGVAPTDEPEAIGLKTWQKVGLAFATATSVIVPVIVHEIQPTIISAAIPAVQADASPDEVSRQWEEATASDTDQAPPLVLPHAGDARLKTPPLTIPQTRDAVGRISFPPVNPYAASILADVWAQKQGKVEDQTVHLQSPAFPHHKFTVGIGLENGPHAPMLLILPGIHGSSTNNKVKALERMALENGMNYTEIPNPMSSEWQKDRPAHEPGNPAWESEVLHEMLGQLKTQYPAYYEKVSVTGYSYGALLGASLVRYEQDHPGVAPIVNGSLVSLSPPMQLMHSMENMDHLRDGYQGKSSGSVILTALKYRSAVKKFGFDHIMDSPIAREKNYTTEEKIVDAYGSRKGEANMVEQVDEFNKIDLLPLNNPEADMDDWQELSQKQMEIVQNYTYQRYVGTYLAHDPWFAQNHTTPEALVEDERYSTLLKDISGHGVPVLTLTSADDYILKPQDVQDFRQLQQSPAADQVTRVFDYGGHTGLMFSPAVRQSMMDFLKAPPVSTPPVVVP